MQKIFRFHKTLSCAIFITISAFLTTDSRALAAKCHATDNVQGGDVVILQEQTDLYLGTAYSGAKYYYLTTTPDYNIAGRHKIQGPVGDLSDRATIHLQIVDKNGWDQDWLAYNLAGAFADSTTLYYWTDYDAKSNWLVERPGSSTEVGPIKYGEQIYLKNGSYSEYLVSTSDGYTTTESTPRSWRFLEYCPDS